MDSAIDTSTRRPDGRKTARTNLFVLAAISSATASGPVKVRNLSPNGAMIEGASLPAPGDRIVLHRGENDVSGTAVWCIGGRAGLRFDGAVDVAEWMPGGHAGQVRVDQAFQQIKGTTPAAPAVASLDPHEDMLAPPALRRLARALDALADEIADDTAAIAKFGTKLQALDIASQTLRRMADRAA